MPASDVDGDVASSKNSKGFLQCPLPDVFMDQNSDSFDNLIVAGAKGLGLPEAMTRETHTSINNNFPATEGLPRSWDQLVTSVRDGGITGSHRGCQSKRGSG